MDWSTLTSFSSVKAAHRRFLARWSIVDANDAKPRLSWVLALLALVMKGYDLLLWRKRWPKLALPVNPIFKFCWNEEILYRREVVEWRSHSLCKRLGVQRIGYGGNLISTSRGPFACHLFGNKCLDSRFLMHFRRQPSPFQAPLCINGKIIYIYSRKRLGYIPSR